MATDAKASGRARRRIDREGRRAVVLVALLSLALLSSCASPRSAPAGDETRPLVRLGFPGTNRVFQGLLGVGQQTGVIEEELAKAGWGIEFVAFSGMGPAVNEALASGKIDLAIYADFPGIIAKSRGVEIDLLGIPENRVHASLVVRTDSPIATIAELRGKKIGLIKGTFVQKFLLRRLAQQGLSTRDVELVDLNLDQQSALVSGHVDALALIQSSVLQLTLVQKVAKIIDSSTGDPWESSQFVFVGAHRFVQAHQDAVVAIHRGLLRAREQFRADPESAYRAVALSGMALEVARALFQEEAPSFRVFAVGITEESIRRLDDTQTFMAEQGLIGQRFDTARWADSSFYERARQP